MGRYRYVTPPIAFPLVLLLLVLLVIVFSLFSQIVTLAFQKLGLPAPVAYTLFVASILGSFINIPIAEQRSYVPILRVGTVRFFGIPYPVPYFEMEEQKTVIAVNVGGALVPLSVVLYETVRLTSAGHYTAVARMTVAVLIAALVSHAVSRPVKGMGIAVPTLIPPLIAVVLALLLGGQYRPLVAYSSGTLGVLIGADLMNWRKIRELGAPMVSIGGAGTFDGIFLAGIIAVLLV